MRSDYVRRVPVNASAIRATAIPSPMLVQRLSVFKNSKNMRNKGGWCVSLRQRVEWDSSFAVSTDATVVLTRTWEHCTLWRTCLQYGNIAYSHYCEKRRVLPIGRALHVLLSARPARALLYVTHITERCGAADARSSSRRIRLKTKKEVFEV